MQDLSIRHVQEAPVEFNSGFSTWCGAAGVKYRIAEPDVFAMDMGGKGLQEWGFPVLAVG